MEALIATRGRATFLGSATIFRKPTLKSKLTPVDPDFFDSEDAVCVISHENPRTLALFRDADVCDFEIL
jgi:hypothetical protein